MMRTHIQDTTIEREFPIQTRFATRGVIEATIDGIVRTITALLRTKARRNDPIVAITIGNEDMINAAGAGQATALIEASIKAANPSRTIDLDQAPHVRKTKATNITPPAEGGQSRPIHE